MAVHDNADDIERHLPLFLQQEYKGEVQVVIVDESSTDGTSDVLKRFCHQHNNIYVSFVPPTSRYVSRRKLALTIGVKAAKHEWVLFCDITCYPSDNHWLESLASTISEDTEMVIGLTVCSADTTRAMQFFHAEESARVMAWGSRGKAIRYNGKALAIRKQLFLSTNGFLNNLKFKRGEYDYLVNEHGANRVIATHCDNKHHLIIRRHSQHSWINEQLFYKDTYRHLQRRTAWTLIHILFTVATALAYLIPLAAIVIAAYLSQWLWMGIAIGIEMIAYGIHAWLKGRRLRRVALNMPYALIPLFSLRSMMHKAWIALRYAISDKSEYIRR